MRWCGHVKKLKCLGMLEVENKITRTGGVRGVLMRRAGCVKVVDGCVLW